ncbi:VIT domain-containing protein [Thermodesulfobacteriota bacterium]
MFKRIVFLTLVVLLASGITDLKLEASMFPFPEKKENQFSPTDMLPFVAVPEGEKPVELRSLEIRVTVMGLYAETTQTMRFFNPNERALEGALSFPLPDNAVVCGYALDVAGQMVDGVVVPKQEARRILELEERKGADPGIVEQVQGNVYRTRIYPIPANGSRTVKIVSVSDLTVQGDDAAYHLPLTHARHIDTVDLHVEVIQAPVTPDISGGPGNLTLNQWQDRWVAEATLGKGTPSEDLQVRLPRLPDTVTTIEKYNDKEIFFSVSKKLPETTDQSHWKPGRIALAWDASGSRVDIDRDLDFLQEMFSFWQDLTVDVQVFRNRGIEEVHSFTIENGSADKLHAYLKELPYDGGTSLAALDLGRPPHKDVEAWFLFSDGMGTLEQGLPGIGEIRVFTITGQANSHSALMKHLAARGNGLYINLLRTSPTDAGRILSRFTAPVGVAGATGSEALHITTNSTRITVVGQLTEPQGTLTLSGPGAPVQKLSIDANAAAVGRIITRAWAGLEAQVVGLVDDDDAGRRLLELGRKYGLVTGGTSLLVLESLDQYLEYDIEPPATLAEMRTEFHRLKAERDKDFEKDNRGKLATVLNWWQARIQWWEKDFKADLAKIRNQAEKLSAADGESESVRLEMADSELAESPMAAPRASAMGGVEGAMSDLEMDAMDTSESGPTPLTGVSITIKPWSPDTPYLKAIKKGATDQAYRIYLEQQLEYGQSPAFFLDCGDFFLNNNQPELGLRILSNLVEMGLDDASLMRMYAWRLQQAEEFDLAIELLERIRRDRDDEPQSHRDLALALGERWQKSGSKDDATRAMELLYDVILGEWENFPEIEIIALMELNRLIHFAGQVNISVPARIDPRLIRLLDLDIRINMSWDTDMTDVDLHLFEPTGEHAYYGHNLTQMGGLVSRDFTQGYGPEEYVLKKALPGTYIIKAHYYGSSQQTVSGACTVIVTVFTNYGRESEKQQVLTLRLKQPNDDVVVGEITIDKEGTAAGPQPRNQIPDWKETFRQLKREMSIDEITGIAGQPLEIQGSETMLLIYRPEPGVVIHVKTAPKLISVEQIMDGAVLDLLRNK